MKLSMALEVSFLLAFLVWPCAETIYVTITCSMDWMMVQVIPHAYSRRVRIHWWIIPGTRLSWNADTNIWISFYISCWCLWHRTQVVSEHTLLFQTELYYNPRNRHRNCHSTPLEWSASRKSVQLTPVSTDNEIKWDSSPFIADFKTTPEELGLLSSN